ncbi:nostrin [Protopterus annectens]|uniref:nostrin n=1 Tax=Protopterus annectens TaxID=7888 RepID=UPI001CFC2B4B|nr:nostrin [Protopterus annectens]
MKDPLTGCTYDIVFQNLKLYSKNGENFCKELMAVLQQRADLESSYAKGLQKLASKLTKASGNVKQNSIYNSWTCVSQEMNAIADLHRKLGAAVQLEAIQPLCQVVEDHAKKKKPLDSAVAKMAKLVNNNWNQQIKVKKKLMNCTKEHEAIFHLVEDNKHLLLEKDRQKLLTKLKKSSESLTKTDDEYYQLNMAGLDTRLKWESTLEHCYKSIQDLEKERIQLLCNILNKYSQHVSSFGETLISCQKQIHEAINNVDAEKDIHSLIHETSLLTEENKSDFLLADYYEEDIKTVMELGRRKSSIGMKVQRLQNAILKGTRDKDGLEKMIKMYRDNPAFSDRKTLEDTAAILDETNLRLNLLEASLFKLTCTLADLEKKAKPDHPVKNCISKWKEKDCEHSTVQISRPVKMKRLPQNMNLMTSTTSLSQADYPRGSQQHLHGSVSNSMKQLSLNLRNSTEGDNGEEELEFSATSDEEDYDQRDHSAQSTGTSESNIGTCKALYDYTAVRDDELNLKAGDFLIIHQKDDDGWWYGTLKEQKGHFPATYVEELPHFQVLKSSEA